MAGGLRIRGGCAVVAPRVLEFQWGDIIGWGENMAWFLGRYPSRKRVGGLKGLPLLVRGKITPRTKPAWAEGAGGVPCASDGGEKKK